MPTIGEYRDYVLILPRVLADADATGEEVGSWPDPDPAEGHWARIEAPGGSEGAAPPVQSGDSATLRFRHEAPVAAVDHVRLDDGGAEYAVTGVWRERSGCGGWQTVCSISGPL